MQGNKVAGSDSTGKSGEFDMIVVGGGITGCGIARDAVLRGLRVVLLEMNDFGSGTSSRSSRLIHGGVRYLEHGHLHLVFEASAERRRLLRLAPQLVRPLRFSWPVYRGARIRLWRVAAGLTVYDLLAMFRNVGRHRLFSAGWMKRLQPALRTEGLVGGATYFDAATDDARLTLAVAMDARNRGALMLNHTKVERLIIEHEMARGVAVRDVLTGKTAVFRAPMIVNATGPWTDRFQALEGEVERPRVHGSKGVHVAVAANRIGNRGAVTLLSPDDGRVMFTLPAGAFTIIGTTDTFTSSSPDDIRANEGDVRYLLTAANHFFPAARLERSDVVAAWAGIRPLATSSAGNPVAASREHVITVTPAGVVTITGGKLTTFRLMAQQTVDRALQFARLPFVKSRTAREPILWGPVPGSEWSGDDAEFVQPEHTYRWGDIRFACEQESARTLADLLIRRTHLAFEQRDNALALAPRVAGFVAPILGWSAADVSAHLDRYAREIESIFSVEP